MRAKRIVTAKYRLAALALTALLPLGGFASQAGAEFLPTGKQITPTAAAGSTFGPLNPDLPGHPDFTAGQAVTTATSPDGKTLLILTSGYNSQNDAAGNTDPAQSNEYVFVYDISVNPPVKKQVLQLPNTFDGLAWNPNGTEFYVSGGPNDNVHIFDLSGGTWSEAPPSPTSPVKLGHSGGVGLGSFPPTAAGLAVTDDGKKMVVANFENDSVSVVNLATRMKIGELDLRPGKINAADHGVPGGEYPFWVAIKGSSKAYVSSIRDREIVVLNIAVNPPTLITRIHLNGKPNKMILNKAQTLLFAATDVTDTITEVDTTTDTVAREIPTTAPSSVFSNPKGFKGSSPNSLVLSPDENTLYVTNGGTNSVAVIRLAGGGGPEVAGLIPTGWYPNSVSLNANGSIIYVVNGKSNAGPNPQNCKDKNGVATGNFGPCNAANQYVWQLTKAGFSVIPKPSNADLTNLTLQVTQNNGFQSAPVSKVMQLLGGQIKHVIYVVKENRTYDQMLGDLEIGNGDPSIVVFPEPISPNHHMLAREFVTLDNFYDSGEVSGDGWNWTTQARTTDSIEKTEPVNYAGRAFTYDWEGVNRNLNVGYATVADRQAANPVTPGDPDLLPGATDIAAADSLDGEAGAGYLWDAALHAGLTVRNYGFFCDLTRYSLPAFLGGLSPTLNNPDFGNALGSTVVAFPSKPALQSVTDSFYRGYDNKFPDFWRIKEWQREFDSYVANGNLPNLEFVRIMHDHFGSFGSAVDGVNTIDKQMADNDYALGALVDTVAHSPFADSTLIFVVEDDSQDGPDHVDAHRSIAYVIGPHVKQSKLVSTRYTTVNMVRTIEDVLGITPLNLNDGFEGPMTDVFENGHNIWTYNAIVPDVLRTTSLPLPAATANAHRPSGIQLAHAKSRYDAAYLEALTRGMDFSVEDHVDAARFNRIVWAAMKGDNVPYPTKRDGRDLRHDRALLLKSVRLPVKGVALPEKQARSIDNSAG